MRNDKDPIAVEEFNNFLSVTAPTSKQKISTDIDDLNCIKLNDTVSHRSKRNLSRELKKKIELHENIIYQSL